MASSKSKPNNKPFFIQFVLVVYVLCFWKFYRFSDEIHGIDGVLPIIDKTVQVNSTYNLVAFYDCCKQDIAMLCLKKTYFANVPYIYLYEYICCSGFLVALASLTFLSKVKSYSIDILSLLFCAFCYISLANLQASLLKTNFDPLFAETAFLAVIFAISPSIGGFLLNCLLFKVHFMTIATKIEENNVLSTEFISTFFESKCLTTPIDWYFYQLPVAFNKVLVSFWLLFKGPIAILLLSPVKVLNTPACILSAVFTLIFSANGWDQAVLVMGISIAVLAEPGVISMTSTKARVFVFISVLYGTIAYIYLFDFVAAGDGFPVKFRTDFSVPEFNRGHIFLGTLFASIAFFCLMFSWVLDIVNQNLKYNVRKGIAILSFLPKVLIGLGGTFVILSPILSVNQLALAQYHNHILDATQFDVVGLVFYLQTLPLAPFYGPKHTFESNAKRGRKKVQLEVFVGKNASGHITGTWFNVTQTDERFMSSLMIWNNDLQTDFEILKCEASNHESYLDYPWIIYIADKILQGSQNTQSIFSKKLKSKLLTENNHEYSVMAVKADIVRFEFTNIWEDTKHDLTSYTKYSLEENNTVEYFPTIEKDNDSVKYFLESKGLKQYRKEDLGLSLESMCKSAPLSCIISGFLRKYLVKLSASLSICFVLSGFLQTSYFRFPYKR